MSVTFGSARLTGEAPGLQIRCEALIPSRVGSIPMHFRQSTKSDNSIKGFSTNQQGLACPWVSISPVRLQEQGYMFP